MGRYLVGITGGMASGKSTVVRWLGEAGSQVVDADRIVAELYAPGGKGAAAVRDLFGDGTLKDDGSVDHPAVAECAVISKPDEKRTNIVKAFIVLNEGHAPSDMLAMEIQAYVRDRLAAHEYPREVSFENELPMTTTGKVIRRLLREKA